MYILSLNYFFVEIKTKKIIIVYAEQNIVKLMFSNRNI